MKVLLFSNDTMPFGSLPTSGGGLRCWQIYQGLISQGIEVVASMPSFTFLTKKYFAEIPGEVRENLWEWHTQDEIYKRVQPDAVIYSSNWDHYNLSSKPNVPLIIDLHGSRLIETSLWGQTPDINKKLETFSKADCLLAAGQKQKMYFYGWLMQAGRVPEETHFIRHIPISLAPEPFKREDIQPNEYPLFVSGGGWFPWQDQSNAIFSICKEVIERGSGTLKIYGTPHENDNPTEDELKIRSIYERVLKISKENSSIVVKGYVGRDELLTEYAKASVAVELMNYNLERELAFTTRTIEYLWCGLPVLYNNYSEISEHISDYDAGWTVDPQDNKALTEALHEIFSKPDVVKRKSENAQRLVADRFSWDKTIHPLIDFLHNPQIIKQSKPIKGFSYNSSPYLNPQGNEVSVVLRPQNVIEQEFVFPAEGIWAVQLPIQLLEGKKTGTINCTIKNSLGFSIGSVEKDLTEVDCGHVLFIHLSRVLRPRGGSKGRLIIKLSGLEADFGLTLKALSQSVYPLENSKTLIKLEAQDNLGRPVKANALALSFVPGTGRLFELKMKVLKSIWLLRQGDIKRVIRAVLKRAPALQPVLKHFL